VSLHNSSLKKKERVTGEARGLHGIGKSLIEYAEILLNNYMQQLHTNGPRKREKMVRRETAPSISCCHQASPLIS
jgi:hypothetical protein